MEQNKKQYTYKEIWSAFKKYCKSKKITIKIVGDLAFRDKDNRIIRYVGFKNGYIKMWYIDRYEKIHISNM